LRRACPLWLAVGVVTTLVGSAYLFKSTLDKRTQSKHKHAREREKREQRTRKQGRRGDDTAYCGGKTGN
jgi:heme exporter protein D